uniref:G_PROTEIN_RECEP_F1_2 domain-containing protein n=1 Tax=Steinernema glaseri TaxID=37863 RepID=A0A1I8AMF3_9BILA
MSEFLITSVFIYVIGIFGLFGNVNILIAIARMKPRLKSGILVGLLAFADLFCIVSELQNATRTLLHVQSYRRECFWAISSYLVMTEVQGLLMTALSFDRLFAFAYPFKLVEFRYCKTVTVPST